MVGQWLGKAGQCWATLGNVGLGLGNAGQCWATVDKACGPVDNAELKVDVNCDGDALEAVIIDEEMKPRCIKPA